MSLDSFTHISDSADSKASSVIVIVCVQRSLEKVKDGMAVSCQRLWGAVCGREKVGNIFSFGVPWKIAVEMRLCFMAVIQAQNAADRRDREEETGSGQQKQDWCNCSMTDAGETARTDPMRQDVFGVCF